MKVKKCLSQEGNNISDVSLLRNWQTIDKAIVKDLCRILFENIKASNIK